MKVYRGPQVEPQVNSAAGCGLSAGCCAIMLLCLSPLWASEPIDECNVSMGNTAPAGQSNPPNHLSMFLEVTDSKAGSSEWSCFVSHRLSVVNQKFEGDRYNTFICSSARQHQQAASRQSTIHACKQEIQPCFTPTLLVCSPFLASLAFELGQHQLLVHAEQECQPVLVFV